MKMIFLATCLLGFTLQVHADPSQSLNLSDNFTSASVDMTRNSDGIIDILIPAGDEVNVKVLRNDAERGCKSLGVSNGGMAWTVELELNKADRNQSCTFKVTEDDQSVLITLHQE